MRYWLSNGDGKTYGPYEVEELRKYAAEGRLDGTVQLCAEGSSQWVPASSVVAVPNASFSSPAMGGGGLPPTPPLSPQGTQERWVPVSLVSPILTTLCCCLPLGIASIVYATKANGKGALGDIECAKSDAAKSQSYMTWSVVLGIVAVVLRVIVTLANNP